MFTGLVKEVGTVRRLLRRGREGTLEVACREVLEGARIGDSIAVDGACLTVEELLPDGFRAFLSGETLSKTTLGTLKPGQGVHLEPALRPTDPLGGHMVQGHVEGVGEVKAMVREGEGWRLEVEVPRDLLPYVVPKGSIAISGVSLTVASLRGGTVRVAVVPATLKNTTFGSYRAGRKVNVETDLVGRYVVHTLERLLPRGGGLTLSDLEERGY
ncbi:MAG: riboflavin synthase [Acidobacteriota bacterium]